MKPNDQTSPAAASPVSSLAITPQPGDEGTPSENEIPLPRKFVAVTNDPFTRRGIPESALHD